MRSLLIFILLFSCGKRENGEPQGSTPTIEERTTKECGALTKDSFVRCDYGTFASYAERYCPSKPSFDVAALESPKGKWHRHFEACYPDHSKTETTAAQYVAVLHQCEASGDCKGVARRVIDYAAPRLWTTGKGEIGVTNISFLVPLLYRVAEKPIFRDSPEEEERRRVTVSGFKAHETAMFLWKVGRQYGGLNDWEMKLLMKLRSDNPESPIIEALASRYAGESRERTEKLMEGFKECERLWGSAPDAVCIAMVNAILRGE